MSKLGAVKAKLRKMPVIGWREWIALPDLGIPTIKAKIDTGARTSSLHAFDIRPYTLAGRKMVRFRVHPFQRDKRTTIESHAELIGYRHVRNSGGQLSLRPVVLTTVEIFGKRWPIELTLAGRDAMGFRMLLGRQALRGRFLVHPSLSFFGSKLNATARPVKEST